MKSADMVLFSGVKGSTSSVDAEVLKRTRELMRSEGLSYSAAFKALLASDTALARQYHARHRVELPEDHTSAGRNPRLTLLREGRTNQSARPAGAFRGVE
jgi:hypothetical protein